MPKINPSLNLNKTPQSVENNSIIFAKNIMYNKDGSIRRDFGISPVEVLEKINSSWLTNEKIRINNIIESSAIADISKLFYTNLKEFYESDVIAQFVANINNFSIVDVISYNTKFYVLVHNSIDDIEKKSFIIGYDEHTEIVTVYSTAWNYSGGDIIGKAIENNKNEVILNIAESKDNDNIPFKSINLSYSTYKDDESFYTQAPKIPFYNLQYSDRYVSTIPSAVYQFFIRYKIRSNFYTNWFPASIELFAARKEVTRTHVGTLRYVETASDGVFTDSDESFVFTVDKPLGEFNNNNSYKAFQVGFILSHDLENYARSWKEFPMDTKSIYFSYNVNDIKEENIDEFLQPTFNLYNVKNLTYFKNKTYISNYKESNFNFKIPEELTKDIKVELAYDTPLDSYTSKYKLTFDEYGYIRTVSGRPITNILQGACLELFDWVETSIVLPEKKEDTFYSDGITCKRSGPYIINFDDTGIKPTSSITDGNDSIDFEGLPFKGIYNLFDESTNKYYINFNTKTVCVNGNVSILNVVLNYYEPIKTTQLVEGYTREGYRWFSSKVEIIVDKDLIVEGNARNNSSLVPYQFYKVFVHYVTANGEIMNGIEVADFEAVPSKEDETKADTKSLSPIKLKFSGIQYNSDYPVCFFSLSHYKNNVCALTNEIAIQSSREKYITYDCIEIDSRLFSAKSITYEIDGETIKGNYYPSQSSTIIELFNDTGKIAASTLKTKGNKRLYGTLIYDNDNKNAELTRCTPFISSSEYSNYENENLLGYVCYVSKPYLIRDDTGGVAGNYFSGSDLYYKRIENSNLVLELTDTLELTLDQVNVNLPVCLYSNFNLDYLSLSEDIGYHYKTIRKDDESHTWNMISVDTLNISDIYELNKSFYVYDKPTYERYKDEDIVIYEEFENTIRSSVVVGDESTTDIIEFNAEDYYTVPKDKGSITKLISIGDAILVHTQDSIYKFVGSNSLSSEGGNIQLNESQPFETGISELFGSAYGFAGLAKRDHALITEEGYLFYDEDCGKIYLYGGNNEMSIVSDSIKKMMEYNKIKDVCFASDVANSRILVNITFVDDNYITLSLNTDVKNFVSLHDYSFSKSFSTKNNCYFIHNSKIYKIDKDSKSYSALAKIDYLYPAVTESNQLTPQPRIIGGLTSSSPVEMIGSCPILGGMCYGEEKLDAINQSNKSSIIDVIFNMNYEKVKTLDSISWICSKVDSFINTNAGDILSLFVAEELLDRNYAGDIIKIYSDSAYSGDINLDRKANEYSISSADSYKRPRYNNGVWSLNYFRNILNNEKLYPNYPDSTSDNSSLIYGKYFVVRFIFKSYNNFKLENITFNINNQPVL